MSLIGKIQTLFSDKDKTKPVFPRTKVSAVSDDNGVGLDALLNEIYYELDNIEIPEGEFVPITGGAYTGPIEYITLSGGNITSSGNITATGNITGAKVYGAVYNDYAEFFPRGEKTEPGDLITLDLDSDEEKYIKATSGSIFLGIHTDEYAHLIGGENPPKNEDYVEYNIKNYIPVALTGRVHVKVIGPVRKGDYIIASDIPGVGVSGNKQFAVGYCLENNNNPEIKKVKVRVI